MRHKICFRIKIKRRVIIITSKVLNKKETPVEICSKCKVYYGGSSFPFMAFENFSYETLDALNEYTKCCVCNKVLKRHHSFLDSLRKTRDSQFLVDTKNKLSPLMRLETLEFLLKLIEQCSVPSFCVITKVNKNNEMRIAELLKLNYVRRIERVDWKTTVLILNAKELKLYDNLEILDTISIQSSFSNPYVDSINRRKIRLESLFNDFSLEDKQKLLERFNNKCAFTGKEIDLHLDHVIPVAWEVEGTVPSNILPLWSNLNSSKHDSNVFEWYKNKGMKYEVKEDLFIEAITYIAELNDMSFEEYKNYVYECDPKSK